MTAFRGKYNVLAWALYDFANTIYSLNILSFHFPLWLTSDRGVPEWIYAVAFAASSLVAAFALPVSGYLCDRFEARRRLLIISTLLCVACTAMIAFTRTAVPALFWFSLSHIFYQAALVFYNARLVDVGGASERSIGTVSGVGVALGYAGTITGLVLTRPFFASGGHQATFLPTAALFLIFALPCLVLRAPRPAGAHRTIVEHLRAYHPSRVWRMLGASPALRDFSIYSFWILNVAAVATMFMTVFAKQAAGLSDGQIDRMVLVSSISGIAGALLGGWAYGRMDAVRQLGWITAIWIAAFAANIFYRNQTVFFIAASLAGVAFGSTWSMTRAFLLRLIPPGEVGEYYGIFGFMARIASLTGLLFTGVALKACEMAGLPRYDLLNLGLLGAVLLSVVWLVRTGRDIARTNGYNKPL